MYLLKEYHSDYTRKLDRVDIRKEYSAIIQTFYGTLQNFVRSHPKLFRLSRDQTRVQMKVTRGVQLTPALLLKVLDTIIPQYGSMKLDTLAVFASDVKSTIAYQAFLAADEIGEKYVAKTNKDKKTFIYRLSDAFIPDSGFTLGDNKATAMVLEGAAYMMPYVPTYWVSYRDICDRLTGEAKRVARNRGIARMALLMGDDLMHARYTNTQDDFCKRPAVPLWEDVPACVADYDGYNLSPERILKLAFCIPSEFTPIGEVYGKLFPSIARWGQESCAYPLVDVVRMFPEAMEIRKPDCYVRSLLRSEHADLAPEPGNEGLPETERAFEERLNAPSNQSRKQKLLESIGAPSDTVFRVVERVNTGKDGYKFINWKGEKFYLRKDTPTWTDQELLNYLLARLPDETTQVTLSELMDDLHLLPYEEYMKFRNALHLRHESSLVKFFKRSSREIEYEEIFEGANMVDHRFFRTRKAPPIGDNTINVAQVNEYLDPKKLIERYKEIYHLSRVRRKPIITISTQLGERARTAARQQGGVRKFAQSHPDIFLYREEDDSVELLE